MILSLNADILFIKALIQKSTLTNKMLPNTILVKYEKNFVTAGAQDYEFRIAAIGQDGEILFLDDKFKDLFERASFLAECKLFDIEDANEYEKID